jgi:Uma2 family endonuclease
VTTARRTASPPPAGYLRAPAQVRFPEAELVPETKRHLEQRTLLYQVLTLGFGDQAAIGCDQFVYWDPTDPRQCLAPDAFVRLGVRDEPFRVWKVWERGAPDVAVEILSESDERDRDFASKLEKYRRLGVRELVCFDSEREPASLRIWGAVDGDLVEREIEGLVGASHCLPATWVVVPDAKSGALLRLSHDPEGKDLLPTPAEHERRQAEHERRQAEQARSTTEHERQLRVLAEERILELEEQLRQRGT